MELSVALSVRRALSTQIVSLLGYSGSTHVGV
jgi:hypothetical protein